MDQSNVERPTIRVGMVGAGMIFRETYAPVFRRLHANSIYRRDFGAVDVSLRAIATRTGARVRNLVADGTVASPHPATFAGANSVDELIRHGIDVVCIATPDDHHFAPARAALVAGKHVLIEKPSVLNLHELDELNSLAAKNGVLAKVVYHKLADPDHKMLRTHVADGVLRHVNHGYCSLLEPKQISGSQFAEWIQGRNPATYVAVHYVKLIDFTFGGPHWRLARIHATGQRGLVAAPTSATWDSVQLQIVYAYADGREAAFDVHTSWVTPDNFPGYVEQEVQFRFDNAVWNAHQRRRGVEVTVEGRPAEDFKSTPNHHYNAESLEPWNERVRRGYGLEVIQRFFEEVAFVEYGRSPNERDARLARMRNLVYNDLTADRNVVAVVHALERILAEHASGRPGSFVEVNGTAGGLVLHPPGESRAVVLYQGVV
jgi:predicted dehydrogenase